MIIRGFIIRYWMGYLIMKYDLGMGLSFYLKKVMKNDDVFI